MCGLTRMEHFCGHRNTNKWRCKKVLEDEGRHGDCGNVLEKKNMAKALGLPQVPWAQPEDIGLRHQQVRPHHLPQVQALHDATKTRYPKYNAMEHIKWTGMVKPLRPPPPVPVYRPSVGNWV
ncbi:hypothetical protein LX32DRAFT_652974 [Colletotrichum zoysiae]|uniref:Uncharacterized protein n=1 Tax=Colletotrichum zoysiae TaxID=1216348 RepID=A0AAD9M4Y6_9PEZI|nr:hypothetical protein LX32DRAFT_652974 [Colletotrichum zoysiae]